MADRRSMSRSRGATRVGLIEADTRQQTRRIGGRASPREITDDGDVVVGDARPEAVADPLYPVALLKIAMAMKRLDPREELHFERLLDDVLSDLVLDRDDFRRYLDRNMGRLMAAVRARGY